MLDEAFDGALDATDGDGEADALGSFTDGGVDTDDFAGSVDERTTGVAGVDTGVGLKHVA